MVGRFVEQQQVRGAHQRLRQIQAHPPAAGKAADRQLHLLVGKTEAGQQLAGAGIGGIAVGTVQLAVQARQGDAIVFLLGGHQLRLDATQRLVAVQHVIDRQPFERIDLLAHVRDAPVRWHLTIAAIGRQFATQQREQAGLSGAIGAHQPGFLAGIQGQLGAFQQTLGATL